MKKAIVLLATLVTFAAMASDYGIMRDNIITPGGGPGTNQYVMLVHPAGAGAELIEFHAWGVASADTVSVYRVSSCKCVTNAVCSFSSPGSVSLLSSNFTSVYGSWAAADYWLVKVTGVTTQNCAAVYRVHSGAQ